MQYFGGTNFERTAGGPRQITSYDYDAPIDEYGMSIKSYVIQNSRSYFFSFLFIPSRIHNLLLPGILRQPKWGHLKDLHAAIKLCESALTAVDGSPQYVNLGPKQEVCANLWFKNLHFSHLLQPWFLVDHLSKLLFFLKLLS